MTQSEPFRRAVVAGSSMAGLLAARVLSDYFDEVVVLDRDVLPVGPEPRKGAPQGRHLHGMLCKGLNILGDLFPGFLEELDDGGSTKVDLACDMAWNHRGMWKQRVPSGIIMYTQSRPYLEWHVRRHLLRRKNVSIEQEREVTGFLGSEDGRRIRGVSTRSRGSEGTCQEMWADLVVDATGRHSKTPERLVALGYPRIPETKIVVDVGYSTQILARTEHKGRDWKAMMLQPSAPKTRCGMLFPAEGQQWIVTLAGWTRDYPPGDREGFLEYARSLEHPAFYEAIKDERPLSEVQTYRFPSNLRRHYELVSRFPIGLCVVGDALCSFNPGYGQGMTAAACSVEVLLDCLRSQKGARSIAELTKAFRKRAPEAISTPWQVAVGQDYNWPGVKGSPSLQMRLMNAYMRQIHRTIPGDAQLCKTFIQLVNMLIPPSAILLDPKFVLRLAGRSVQVLVGAAPEPGRPPMMGTPLPELSRSGIPEPFDQPSLDKQMTG